MDGQTVSATVVGIGNTSRTDDGVGVVAALLLQEKPAWRAIEFIARDIAGPALIRYFSSKKLVIIDAAKMNLQPGSVRVFRPEDISDRTFKDFTSTHGMGLNETLRLAKELNLIGDVSIIGVEPFDLKFGLELSSAMKEVLPLIVKTAESLLKEVV